MVLLAVTRRCSSPRPLLLLFHHLLPPQPLSSDAVALPGPPDPCSPRPLRGRPLRGRLPGGALPLCLPAGPSLPLRRHLYRSLPCCFHFPLRQVPPLLPRAFPLPCPPSLQDQMRLLNPGPTRGLSSAAAGVVGGESDSGAGAEPVLRSPSHWTEVERVCKLVEELFASDRIMEAVLDQCAVRLGIALVSDVLERFRHAHRPAYRFFRWAGGRSDFTHDAETYNKMLLILGRTRQFESMVALLGEMGQKGFLSMEAFEVSIKAFAAAKEMKKAMGIFQLMEKHGFAPGLENFNCLLGALANEKLGKEANQLFERMRLRFPPDLRTYTVLLMGWCELKNLVEAGRIWNEMIDEGFKPDIVAHNVMLEGLIRGQRRPEAVKLFELMKAKGPSPNVRTYTVLIRDMCKGGKMEHAVACFREMVKAGCVPTVAIYTCMLVGFGNAKQMDKVAALLTEMQERGCPPDGHTYNSLIKLMTNRSMLHDAARIYKRMINYGIEPTTHTYNMMLKSFFRIKDYENGCAVWKEMNRRGVCPDDNSYTVLVGGLIRLGRAEEAHGYLEEMLSKGMKAPQIDYNKFVADFSKAGKPEVLYELAQKVNFQGNPEVYNMFMDWAERMRSRSRTS